MDNFVFGLFFIHNILYQNCSTISIMDETTHSTCAKWTTFIQNGKYLERAKEYHNNF